MLGSRKYSHPTAAEILAHCDTINEYASAADVPQTCRHGADAVSP